VPEGLIRSSHRRKKIKPTIAAPVNIKTTTPTKNNSPVLTPGLGGPGITSRSSELAIIIFLQHVSEHVAVNVAA